MTCAVIPWGPGLQVTDLNVGILYLLAFGAIPVLGVTLAGWASMNKYSLLGGMRAVVQYVSYEVPAGIIVVVPVLMAKTMSLQGIVQAQSGPMWNWFVFQPTFFLGPIPIPVPIIGTVAFLVYLTAGLAEVNRTPFDHVEADSELTGGFTTEYSGMQFSLFFLAEYANAIAVGLLGSSLFLGGYHTGLGDAFDNLIWPLLPGVVVTKAAILFLAFVWVRGTLPRFRYDQLMQFAWKRMLPVSLVLVSLSALFASLRSVHHGSVYQLEPFDHDQQEAFLTRWFHLAGDPDPAKLATRWMTTLGFDFRLSALRELGSVENQNPPRAQIPQTGAVCGRRSGRVVQTQ